MTHRKCTICGEDIVLVPSAKERAEKHGGSPKFYLDMWDAHSHCAVAKRSADSLALMRRLTSGGNKT